MIRPGDYPWRPTVALQAALVTAIGALLLAVVLRRADLVVVAAPFAVGTALALIRPRPEAIGVQVEFSAPAQVWEGDEIRLAARVEVDEPVDAVVLRIHGGTGIAVQAEDRLRCLRPRPGAPVELPVRGRAERWGRWVVGPATVSLTAAQGLLRRNCDARAMSFVSVLPTRVAFEATDALPHAAGMVGGHRSLRSGEGGDLVSLRPFVPGDRLRRITWPASLRTGQLHVRATTEDRDADIELVVDTWSDAGMAGGRSSLDATVRAAASIAEYYLGAGDRVGLLDLGRPARPVRLGAGHRQLQLVFAALLAARPRTPDPDIAARSLGLLRSRALVVVLSTLLSDPIEHLVASLARSGRSILVVDTLPVDSTVPATSEWTPLAWRLAVLRRDTLAEELVERGVPIARWQGARSLDAVLRRLAELSRTPRRVR